MNPIKQHKLLQTRRHFLKTSTLGLGAASFGLLNQADAAPQVGGLPGMPHFAPKAKKGYLAIHGGSSLSNGYA